MSDSSWAAQLPREGVPLKCIVRAGDRARETECEREKETECEREKETVCERESVLTPFLNYLSLSLALSLLLSLSLSLSLSFSLRDCSRSCVCLRVRTQAAKEPYNPATRALHIRKRDKHLWHQYIRQKISTKEPFFAAQDHYTCAKEREALLTHREAQTSRYTRKKSLTCPPKDLYTPAKETEALLTRKQVQKSLYIRKKSLTRLQKRKATLMHGYPQKIPAKETFKPSKEPYISAKRQNHVWNLDHRKRTVYSRKRALCICKRQRSSSDTQRMMSRFS